ncbi:hypothetical protein M513_05719 [Trichuris suis]|uniref:FLYWCH-type domain-containing protein n=1 Tax=Trichuris suis TaxID=68888 RepID=A0A085M8A9_9BILA|nr:hypothetical protein M513_05719 [Trichuris suis]
MELRQLCFSKMLRAVYKLPQRFSRVNHVQQVKPLLHAVQQPSSQEERSGSAVAGSAYCKERENSSFIRLTLSVSAFVCAIEQAMMNAPVANGTPTQSPLDSSHLTDLSTSCPDDVPDSEEYGELDDFLASSEPPVETVQTRAPTGQSRHSRPPDLKVFKTQRGNELIVFRGFDYVKHRENNGEKVVVWRCRSGKDCGGQLRTDRNARVVFQSLPHNHDPVPFVEYIHEAMTAAREMAVKTKLSPHAIYQEVTKGMSPDAVKKIPEKRLLVAMITRIRRLRGMEPKVPVRKRRRDIPKPVVHVFAHAPSRRRLPSPEVTEKEPVELNSSLKLLKTQRSQDMLWCANYEYLKRYENTERGTIDWRCRSRTFCQGKVQTNLACTRVYRLVEHCHPPFCNLPTVHETLDRMRKMGAETTLSPRQIYKACTADRPYSVIEQLPPLKSIREMIYRQRVAHCISRKHPSSLAAINFPPNIFSPWEKQPPIVYDSGFKDGRRMFVFYTNISLKLLEEIPTWLMCEAYKVMPRLFNQLFTIHVAINQTIVPCVYALLSHNGVEDFYELLTVLKNAESSLSPENVITDFQVNAQVAIKRAFPQVELYTCLSHMDEWLWKKIGDFGMREMYCKCKTTKHLAKQLLALAFVPQKEVISVFHQLNSNIQSDDMKRLYSAFQRTFISAPAGVRRSSDGHMISLTAAAKPMFSLTMWNCHDMVSAGYLRVVNSFESWHTSLYLSLVPGSRNVYHIINKISGELCQIDTYLPRLEQLERGSPLWWTTTVIRFDDQLNNVLPTFKPDTKTPEERRAMVERFVKNVCCCIFLPTRQIAKRRTDYVSPKPGVNSACGIFKTAISKYP